MTLPPNSEMNDRAAGSAMAKAVITLLVFAALYFLANFFFPSFFGKNGGSPEGEKSETQSSNSKGARKSNEQLPDGKTGTKTAQSSETKSSDPETPESGTAKADADGNGSSKSKDGEVPKTSRKSDGTDAGSGETRSRAVSPPPEEKAEVDPVVVLENRILALEAKVRSLKSALVRADEGMGKRIDALDEEQGALARKLDRMNAALETMERRVYEHRATIARLERDIRQPGGRIDMRNPVVLTPKKLYRNVPLKLFDGQVMLHLTGFRKESSAEPGSPPVFLGADFEITLPLLDILVLQGVEVGERRVFRYADRDFFLELLGTDEETWARVAITRKLPE